MVCLGNEQRSFCHFHFVITPFQTLLLIIRVTPFLIRDSCPQQQILWSSELNSPFPVILFHYLCFPNSSVVKESTCNTGDPGSLSGLGRSTGEGKKLPTPVFWPGEFHGLYNPWSTTKSWTGLSNFHFHPKYAEAYITQYQKTNKLIGEDIFPVKI